MLENLGKVYEKVVLNQQRITIGCVLRLPEDVRNKTPQDIVQKCVGVHLLSFNFVPQIGELFPYAGQIWEVTHTPIQRPTRYRSHQKKHPALLFLDWRSSYETEDEALAVILAYTKNNR
ncbi:hypothetical protein DSM106972_056440 [Dulcicalothrix desertica PCC 7102]|uniref:Uncharacterized protein n=1 Tax=Dulcicalothrix desertica PCC 7102 TaxID=232991 RepID=A0A433V9F8_9CYAN|nr:hypothetical protein [Dulcicalothrix desertica]RUT02724.1 hypothetical protein DSM106972_056440 [Dulcicalothrix desertica PCC 7102]TWH39041.1 hypothetical protein CAL7102_08245 [Dulcicalothrix desertica PCC 7102]